MKKYAIGLDYGTLDVRALLLDIETGEEVATSVYTYPHGIMDTHLPTGTKLPPGYALQHPSDYTEGLILSVRDLQKIVPFLPEEVIGIGVDATAATILPVKTDRTPLCCLPEFRDEPHAYLKLWKHHGGDEEADIVKQVAEERQEEFLSYYGSNVSSEWMIPKLLETLRRAPVVYEAADRFIDALDWIVWQLTGREIRSACTVGYKAFHHHRLGYPSPQFFKELDPRMENLVEEKLNAPILGIGTRAGLLTKEMASILGLLPGTPVGTGIIDAHASMVGSGISKPNIMLVTMGTSSCHTLLSEQEIRIPGIAGMVKDGILPGFFGYEAGQSCVGDLYAWFIKNCIPEEYAQAVHQRGISIHQLLTEKLEGRRVGQSGLLVLDWFNGVRSPLMDFDLSGLILGLNLLTRPEDIYLALIEATAYGTRLILDTLEDGGVPVKELVLGGGIPMKNPLLIQIYADVCNREILISDSKNTSVKGAAICGVAAADPAVTGFNTISEAAEKLCRIDSTAVRPIPGNAAVYERLYREYRTLCDYFGKGVNDVMKRLRAIKSETTKLI